ncbi:diguanylate cyclase (GGDEF)-like protein [Marinobacterium mangrovicola]|uniref:Diguanylate cyclase (GGDEF)-like protein n=1 Tax=Marinobacterium mangrovicola TaxID=1476959 RepID=A0A4R1GNT8_9GAMM|nr:diguanylate cyclase (GGDEF)-like protein [Marinobacterium mangrovicola]
MLSPRFRRYLPYLAIFVVVCAGVAITETVQRMVSDRTYQVRRIEALGTIAQLRARIESEINSVLYLSHGLISYVTIYPEVEPRQWSELSREIIRGSDYVRNIGLAPDNVISFIYPQAGNEAAIGFDYEKSEKQWPAVSKAIASGGMVLAGPLRLVQGGNGLIARTPIYTNPVSQGRGEYWGLASVVIDSDALFAAAGLESVINGYQIAIRGQDGLGAAGQVFYGDESVFDAPLVEMSIEFPNGNWVVGAIPAGDSEALWLSKGPVRLLAYSILIVLVSLLVALVRLYHTSHGEAMHDALTGLPNRRLMLERVNQLIGLHDRTGLSFALYFIDLNEFKPVNDHYGHLAGDELLKTVGHRLSRVIRGSDTLARTGGDEFMLLQAGVDTAENARIVIAKIQQALSEPLVYRGKEIQISAAVGYAVFPVDAEDLDELIRVADDRMYTAKKEYKALV